MSDEQIASDVSSLRWNQAGTRMLTSSGDGVARVWQVDSTSGQVKLERVKNFKDPLLNSCFNNADNGNLVATGGLMNIVYVWNCEKESCDEVA